jgi:hypothetical protein
VVVVVVVVVVVAAAAAVVAAVVVARDRFCFAKCVVPYRSTSSNGNSNNDDDNGNGNRYGNHGDGSNGNNNRSPQMLASRKLEQAFTVLWCVAAFSIRQCNHSAVLESTGANRPSCDNRYRSTSHMQQMAWAVFLAALMLDRAIVEPNAGEVRGGGRGRARARACVCACVCVCVCVARLHATRRHVCV